MKNSYISKPVHWRIIPSGEETSIPPINTIFYPLCYPTQYNTTMVHCQSKLHQASLALITSPTFTMKKKKGDLIQIQFFTIQSPLRKCQELLVSF